MATRLLDSQYPVGLCLDAAMRWDGSFAPMKLMTLVMAEVPLRCMPSTRIALVRRCSDEAGVES